MASAFTHAFLSLALGRVYAASRPAAQFWWLSAFCAIVPDADVVAFGFGLPYGHMFGHRGFTHSLFFAILLAVTIVTLFFREVDATAKKLSLIAYYFVVTASHGFLDALTDGGLGVAFFAPFHATRYFFPFRPLVVSPIGIGSFFSEWGVAVIASEFVWVWVPSILLVAAIMTLRRLRRSES